MIGESDRLCLRQRRARRSDTGQLASEGTKGGDFVPKTTTSLFVSWERQE